MSTETTEPWLFTPSEISGAFLWGMLGGAICSAPIWVCAGIHWAWSISQ